MLEKELVQYKIEQSVRNSSFITLDKDIEIEDFNKGQDLIVTLYLYDRPAMNNQLYFSHIKVTFYIRENGEAFHMTIIPKDSQNFADRIFNDYLSQEDFDKLTLAGEYFEKLNIPQDYSDCNPESKIKEVFDLYFDNYKLKYENKVYNIYISNKYRFVVEKEEETWHVTLFFEFSDDEDDVEKEFYAGSEFLQDSVQETMKLFLDYFEDVFVLYKNYKGK